MRSILLTLLIVAIMLSASISHARIEKENIIGIWLFEEGKGKDVLDSSGNEHHGEINGAVKWVAGKIGGGLECPGATGNFVNIPHHENLNLSAFTITYWCKMGVTAGWQIPVGKANGANRNFDFQTPANGGTVSLYFTQGASQWKGVEATTIITDEKWHHITGTYDLENLRIYVDGVMEKESKYKGAPDHVDRSMTFGDMENAHPMKGVLDEVGIFSKAFSAEEIKVIMDRGLNIGANPVLSEGKLVATWAKVKTGQ